MATRGPHPKVLLYEDDPDTRTVIAELLADSGIEVVICRTLRDVEHALVGGGVALLLADFWGSSQRTLNDVERAELISLGARVPLILITGRAWSGTENATDLRVARVLQKPFDLHDLEVAVNEVLANNHPQPA
jgi:DNA-binding NtrC family response regulator